MDTGNPRKGGPGRHHSLINEIFLVRPNLEVHILVFAHRRDSDFLINFFRTHKSSGPNSTYSELLRLKALNKTSDDFAMISCTEEETAVESLKRALQGPDRLSNELRPIGATSGEITDAAPAGDAVVLVPILVIDKT